MACCRTKATISLKRVKIEEKLLRMAYRNSPTLFRTVPYPTPYGLPFLEIGGFQLSWRHVDTWTPGHMLSNPLISGTRKATGFKFGGYIYRTNPNKCPLKILEKMERGHIQGLPNFFEYPLLSQEWVKLRTSNLAGIFTGPIRIKAH